MLYISVKKKSLRKPVSARLAKKSRDVIKRLDIWDAKTGEIASIIALALLLLFYFSLVFIYEPFLPSSYKEAKSISHTGMADLTKEKIFPEVSNPTR